MLKHDGPTANSCLVLAPFLTSGSHSSNLLFFKPKVPGDEIRDHKNRACGNPDHLNNLVVRVIRLDVNPDSALDRARSPPSRGILTTADLVPPARTPQQCPGP